MRVASAEERWKEAMDSMKGQELTLSPKISATMRGSLTGMLHILARYKFAMKMMANRTDLSILDLGCNDGLGDLMIRQNTNAKSIVGIDLDTEAITWARNNLQDDILTFENGNFFRMKQKYSVDAVVSLDVIEHIEKEKEQEYRDIVYDSLNEHGFAVIGTPNVTLYPYANPINQKAHINNFDQNRLYQLFAERFRNVFIFGMNDESLNTGFYPFSCYIMLLAVK